MFYCFCFGQSWSAGCERSSGVGSGGSSDTEVVGLKPDMRVTSGNGHKKSLLVLTTI